MSITVALLIVLAVIIIGVLAVTVVKPWAASVASGVHRRRAEQMLLGSAGTFDENARTALQELEAIDDPRPEDNFRRAEIIRYNVAQNNIEPATVLREVIGGYLDAVDGIAENLRAGREIWPREDTIDPMLMLLQVIDLQYQLPAQEDNQFVVIFNNVVDHNVPPLQAELNHERVREVLEDATTGAEAVNTLFDNAIAYTSQPQNVHDSGVNADLNDTLRKLRADSHSLPSYGYAINEARKFIDSSDELAPKAHVAYRVLDIVGKNDYIGTFDTTEGTIFALVWARAEDPRNADNEQLIKEAIVNALFDCYEGGSPVCINGRCARVLGSLTTLDFDQTVGAAMTIEAYKNQIMEETKKIINDTIEDGTTSQDGEMRAAAQGYADGTSIGGDGRLAESQFKETLGRNIDQNLEKYAAKIRPGDLESIRNMCRVYALLE